MTTLDEFMLQKQDELTQFQNEWLRDHETQPNDYPMEFEHHYDWMDQYEAFESSLYQ